MSHTVYSTFRTPQQSKQRRSFLHGGGGPASASPAPGEYYNGGRPSPSPTSPNPNYRSFSEGRHSEGMYAKPAFKSPVSPVSSPSRFGVNGTVRQANGSPSPFPSKGTLRRIPDSPPSSPAPFPSKGTLRRIPDSPPSNDSVRKVPSFLHKHQSAGVGFGGGGGGSGVEPTSKLGNGFNTLPASMHRGVRLYDPLNNVNRFQKRSSGEQADGGETETGSLNNFEFYRNRQGTGTLPRSGAGIGAGGGGHSMSYQHSKVAAPEHPLGMRNKPPPENKPSLLLSPDENRFIFEILGRGRQTLATAVGRLLTPTPDQQQWQVKDSTGAVCLVRDTTKKSYFIQVFSLRAKNMIFRQEIYNQFEYQMPQATFMTFEGDSSMVAILFADSTEASNFREALDGKLEAKRQRRNERETRKSRVLESQVNNVPSPQSNHYASNNNVNTTPPPSSYPNGHTVTTTTTYNFTAASAVSAFKLKKSKGNDKKDNKKKTKLTAKDIGTPMDFRHVQHVGWDPTKGFDLNLEDKDLRTFFEMAGVSANQLNDENTRKFIYNFIEQHGGVDVVKKSANNTNTPTRAPPPVPPSAAGAGPPPVPTRTPSIPNSNYPGTTNKPPPPPPPPSRPIPPPPPAATYPGGSGVVGPPPPPLRTTSSAIQNSPTQYHHHPVSNGPSRPPLPKPAAVNGPSSIATPPPPPPPPMPTGGGAPPPPPPPPPPTSSPPRNNGIPESNGARSGGGGGHSLPPVVDERSQLMKQIQMGVQLKKVDVETQPKRVGGISDCLSEIQKGVDLKPVPEQAKVQPNIDAMDGLAGALARALADRQRALNPDSSSSDDEDGDEYDEEEWE